MNGKNKKKIDGGDPCFWIDTFSICQGRLRREEQYDYGVYERLNASMIKGTNKRLAKRVESVIAKKESYK